MKGVVKYATFFMLCGLVSFSIIDNGKYYFKEQWLTLSSKFFPLRAKPKQVTEYFYGEDSLLKSDLSKYGSYEGYTYDTVGNLVSHKYFFKDDFWYLFTFNYSDDGMNAKSVFKTKKGFDTAVFMKITPTTDGRYRQVIYKENAESKVFFYQFKNNGNEIISESTDSFNNHKSDVYVSSLYDGQRLINRKTIHVNGKDSDTLLQNNFYDEQQFLDSIVIRSAHYILRTLFTKNKQGDPLSEISIGNRDTTTYKTYQYLYDEKGNWIRRVEEDHLYRSFSTQKYYLLVREITY